MTGKELLHGREVYDGEPVVNYESRFKGSFPLDVSDGAAIAQDDTVTFVVTGTVASSSFKRSKTGDPVRINVVAIKGASYLDEGNARVLLDAMGVEMPGVNIDLDGNPLMNKAREYDAMLEDEEELDDLPLTVDDFLAEPSNA
jgi:hypothetical protein